MDFDLRRRPGFRNPPMPPPAPFPGAWETQGTLSWYYRARRNFNFRRPPDHWRSGPPMDPPDDAVAKYHLQHVERSINASVPSHQQHPWTETTCEGSAAHADGSETTTGRQSAYRAQHAVEGGNQQPSGDALSRDEEHLKTDQKDTGDEQAQMADSVDDDGPELLGISILNALEEVAGGGGEWAVGVQGSTSARGEHGEEHEAERDMHPTLYVANPSTQDEQAYGEEFPHTEVALSESVEEEEGLEEVGLVMSPEWAEHLRNSPSVQRYLQRVASKQAPTGKDTRGAEGKQHGGDDASRPEKQSGGAGNGSKQTGVNRKKGKAKKKAGGGKDTTVQKAAENEISSAEKDMELQLAKIRAHALLYAHQQQHRQLEDIIEES